MNDQDLSLAQDEPDYRALLAEAHPYINSTLAGSIESRTDLSRRVHIALLASRTPAASEDQVKDAEYYRKLYEAESAEVQRLNAQVSELEGYHHVAEAHIAQLEAQVEGVKATRQRMVNMIEECRPFGYSIGTSAVHRWVKEIDAALEASLTSTDGGGK